MKEKIKNILLYIKYQHKATSKSYVSYLRKKGITIGENTNFYSPWTIQVDIRRPWTIEIGDNVNITAGCTILQHGYDWSVLQKLYGEVLGSSGRVKIGNNVFIGTKTTILKGVTIGDNVIIGANSLVNKDLPSNGVYAGNPAKFIMSISDYYEKRKKEQVKEAKELVETYFKKYNKVPEKVLLSEFYWLFEERSSKLIKEYDNMLSLNGNYEESFNKFIKTKPIFKDYEEFIKFCLK